MDGAFGLQDLRDVRETCLICAVAHFPHTYRFFLENSNALGDGTEKLSDLKDLGDLDICYQLSS